MTLNVSTRKEWRNPLNQTRDILDKTDAAANKSGATGSVTTDSDRFEETIETLGIHWLEVNEAVENIMRPAHRPVGRFASAMRSE